MAIDTDVSEVIVAAGVSRVNYQGIGNRIVDGNGDGCDTRTGSGSSRGRSQDELDIDINIGDSRVIHDGASYSGRASSLLQNHSSTE
jgi:hypothetical protein